ncbi:MAG: alpha/beta hydrolase [Deltaproteobacteria bacterium]|nr:alpha/beta hydrolase [Deltaproteobacteria bacterium]
MSEAPSQAAVPAWMGDVDPSQIGFPFELDRSAYTKRTGLVYKQTDIGPLHLDAYRPTNVDAPAPLVVMIHGGGWSRGGRYEMGLTRWAGYLASAGLAVVSIDYRLTPATRYPDSFGDCLDAIDWAVENAGDLGADAERIGLWGDSAGGHLVLLTATSQTRPDFAGPRLRTGGERIRAVVAWYPPTDMRRLYEGERRAHDGPTMTEQFVGTTPEQDPERWREVSPIEQAHRDAPPTLILQGTRDLLVPHEQATRYAERLRALGAPHELQMLEGAVHGFDRVGPGDEARRLIEQSRRFLRDALAGD